MPKRKYSGAYAPRKRARYQRRPGRRYQKRTNLATLGFLGIEKKFYDTSLAATNLVAPTDSAGAEFDPSATSMISTPVQGDGEQNRDGKQISCLYLEVSFVINVAAIETTANPRSGSQCFVAVVLDTQTNGAQMNSEDCFKNTSAAQQLCTSVMKNLLFGKRFRILKQKTYNLDSKAISHFANDSFTIPGVQKAFKWFIPLRGLKINFNGGTTAAIANVIDNSIHVIAYTNTFTAESAVPTIAYNARLRFMG